MVFFIWDRTDYNPGGAKDPWTVVVVVRVEGGLG